jgi:hypothetical protein
MPSSDTLTRLELKYCELCGGLWLRPAGDFAVYCPGCLPKMAALPAASAPRPDAERERQVCDAAHPVLQALLALLPCGLQAASWGWRL